MNQIESKYIIDKLTCDELTDLRSKVNAMSDKEIESSMESNWNSYDGSDISAPDSCYKAIKKETNRIPQQKTDLSRRILQIAVVILIPLLIATSFYFYSETKVAASSTMTISTGAGERASVTLPDGTKVVINRESTLSYTPTTFGKSERAIQFDGEAYFNVKKDLATPFIIRTTDVQIRVLGTIFNLCTRDSASFVTLDLEQGSVLFSSVKSMEECTVAPNQSVNMNKLTGKITLFSHANNKTISQWKYPELYFKNASLSEVLSEIETIYGVTITMHNDVKIVDDLFTGTLSSNNINEVMEVLEISFHFKAKIVDKQITITKNMPQM